MEVKRLRGELAEAIEKRRLKPPPAPWWSSAGSRPRRCSPSCASGSRRSSGRTIRVTCPGSRNAGPPTGGHLGTEHLHAEWIRIYGDEENRDLRAPSTWHDRYLPDTLNRLAAALGKCDEAGCQLTRPNRY